MSLTRSNPAYFIASTVGLVVAIQPVSAADTRCRDIIRGESSVQHALTPATDGVSKAQLLRIYERAFAAGQREAIAAWRAIVMRQCPGLSASWLRAQSKSVTECDRAMGGRFTVCAEARPVIKVGGL